MILPLIIKTHQLYSLTYRQCQVALLYAWDLPIKSVADILNVSHKTVEVQAEHVYRALNVRSRLTLAHRLIHDGVIQALSDWRGFDIDSLRTHFQNLPQVRGGNSVTLMKEILANEPNRI
jgi:DNA-binding CsgD family transcriptional regulator